jgi:hypothetical protein
MREEQIRARRADIPKKVFKLYTIEFDLGVFHRLATAIPFSERPFCY